MDMMLGSETKGTFTYVTIPGVGALGSYSGIDVRGKIALVRRGQNTFEEKVQAAGAAGAAGIIIYNNVSGDIRMSVGNYLYQLNNGAGVGCISMSQDDGERLAAKGTGTITLDKSNLAGPFMSDFSSWGPLPDLGIKPEITAHGGDILSAIPGQRYDRLSGTSMASPNQCGVHTLVRQYVKEKYHLTGKALATRVNQLLMSTAGIALNEAGNPYSIRKQGAGLANLTDATTTRSFIGVKEYDENGAEKTEAGTNEPLYKEKTKIELGDDPERTGVYTLKFSVVNPSDATSSFSVDALVYSEGVSKTLTDKDETTSDQRAYMFRDATHNDATISVKASSSSGAAPVTGTSITVGGGTTLDVTVTITLSEGAKDYLNKSFEFGMYVEGFVTLNATDGGVSLRAPFLAFYGDWTEAPIFDLTYFETNPDEINDAIDKEDKIMPDAWATRPIAGLEKDYIGYMGAYYFNQDPSKTQIPAQEEHIALSNGYSDNSLNYIYGVWAGLLRSCKSMDIVITEQVTGREIWRKTESNVRKSYSYGAGIIYGNVEVDFYPSEYNLKNNTKYEVTLTGHLDYKNDGTGEDHKNSKNTYSFVFTTDFSAPQLQDVRYYTEYDEDTRGTRVYADISVYDNHYLQCLRTMVWNGAMIEKEYYTPVYGGENTTNVVTIELTDYLQYVAQSRGSEHFDNGNTLMLFAYDYAMNSSIYELRVPDNIQKIYFSQTDYVISENQTLRLAPELYPTESYAWGLEYSIVSGQPTNVARVVDDTLLGIKKGTTKISVRSKKNPSVSQILNVTVLGAGDDGYRRYDRPTVRSFALTGYKVDYSHYTRYSDEKSVGRKGTTTIFDRSRSVEMYPGEIITVFSDLKAYFPDDTEIQYTLRNNRYAQITQKGNDVTIKALAEGTTLVTATVYVDGKATMYTASVAIEVKDPYVSNGPYLTSYKGLGGVVEIPLDEHFSQISQFAFSFSQSVDRDPSEITEEDPYYTKNGPYGDERPEPITEVHIPEGVEVIDQYAFAKLTGLQKVFLPKSLRQINAGAFSDCTQLTTVQGLEYVQIISKDAFKGCTRLRSTTNIGKEQFNLTEAIAIGAGAFEGCAFKSVTLANVQSAAAGAFKNCKQLSSVALGSKIKMASGIFEGCTALTSITVNTPVIPDNAFNGCTNLATVTLGADVKEVGKAAFAGTKVSTFTLAAGNGNFTVSGGLLLNKVGNEIITAAPNLALDASNGYTVAAGITKIGNGAFSHVKKLESIEFSATSGVEIGEYAFENLTKLTSVTGKVILVGKNAFAGTALTALPDCTDLTAIGEYAFANTKITTVTLGASLDTLGAHAFEGCLQLGSVSLAGEAAIGDYAFYGCKALGSVEFANAVTLGAYAFYDCETLATVTGSDKITILGAYALSGQTAETAPKLTEIDLSNLEDSTENGVLIAPAIGEGALRYASLGKVIAPTADVTIGAYAFANTGAIDFSLSDAFTKDSIVGAHAFENSDLASFAAFEYVKEIGAYAFAGTKIRTVNLAGRTVGEGAFKNCTQLQTVTLPTVVEKETFSGDTALVTASKMDTVTSIGDSAFAGTALTKADLSKATKIGRLAFAGSLLESITLGEDLAVLGDNPFAGTDIRVFTKKGEADEKFGNTSVLTTFDVSEKVKVIDGALYAVLENGKLELVTLCRKNTEEKEKKGETIEQFTVAEGTVRIADYAAAFHPSLTVVYLPYTLKSIGHGAFFGSEKLAVVNFGSVQAPVLEAEYDLEYAAMYKDGTSDVSGNSAASFLNSSPYAADYYPDAGLVWYNNNFKSYVGFTKGLTMVYPKNGVGYDALLYTAYFNYKTVGATVAEDATRAVMEQIAKLPTNITLADETAIVTARMAYDRLSSAQAALVENYDLLTRAEQRLQALKEKPPVDPPANVPVSSAGKGGKGAVTALTVVVILLSAIVVALATVLAILFLKKKDDGEGKEPEADKADDAVDAEAEAQAPAEEKPAAEAEPEKAEAEAASAQTGTQEPAEGKPAQAEEKAEEKPAGAKKTGRKKATPKKAEALENEKEPDME
ncbi:MAG: leucine-rich repeat protein [Clostridiales bacterium]|nr:leucine-rich repeat protein [Clostridiales bacterium]